MRIAVLLEQGENNQIKLKGAVPQREQSNRIRIPIFLGAGKERRSTSQVKRAA